MVSSREPDPVSSSDPEDDEDAQNEDHPPIELQSIEVLDSQPDKPAPAVEDKSHGHGAATNSLVKDLGVADLSRTYVRMDGREFAAAGTKYPVVEIDYFGMVMHHPDKPLCASDKEELISVEHDEHGIVLNELGERRKVAGARFRGRELFWHRDTIPESTRHYVAWFDEEWKPHSIFLVGNRLTVDMVLKMRSRTVNGELSVFPEVSTD